MNITHNLCSHHTETEYQMHGLNKAAACVNIDALRAEKSAINKRAQVLTAERATLSLDSVLGDTKAKQRIAEIDEERQALGSRIETVEAAIKVLQQTEQQTSWRKHLPGMELAYRAELSGLYRNWRAQIDRLMIGRQSHDLRDLRFALEDLARLEHDTAKLIADRCLPLARMPSYLAGDQADFNRARKEHVKLVEQRNATITEVVAELVATNNLKRPSALVEAIARARQRLAVSK
jgi:hypothetical protein